MDHIKQPLKFLLAVLMLGATIALAAFDPVNDDTDIFLANPNIAAQRPNVLIIVDNTANWNTAFDNEKNALVQVVNGLPDGVFNVGLMMMAETGGGNDTVDGGYVRFHVREMNVQNKTRLATMVGNLDQIGDRSNNAGHGQALFEAFLYYGGKQSVASHGKVKTDKDNTIDPILSLYATPDHALPSSTGSTNPPPFYRSPISDGCARNFVILISNGPADNSTNEMAVMQGRMAALTGVSPPTIISLTPNGRQGNWADEMARYMANADVMTTTGSIPNSDLVQNVYTYVVEVDPGTTGLGPDWTAVMKSTAASGKGKYFAVSSNASGVAIVDALNAIFNEVQAVNSVFASTTLPVSVNVRGTNLNQVYIGVFRPDPNKSPRWLGNLKMYNLALNTANNTVFLADASNGPPPAVGNAAESSTTGFISQNASSFWTVNSNYWAFRDPSQNGPGGPSDKPDGDLVEKGGAAQQLRLAFASAESSSPARRLYTCTSGDVSGTFQDCVPNAGFSLLNTPFSTTNDAINAAALQLDTRLVSPLTAYISQTTQSITDRLPVRLINTWPTGTAVSSVSTGGVTANITNLTTAVSKPVSSLTGLVSGTISVPIVNITKSGNVYIVTTSSPFSGVVHGTTVIGINCTGGTSQATFNGLSDANRTVSASGTSGDNYIYTIPGPQSGNHSCSAGTASGPGTQNSTTAQAVVPGHGFTDGQSVAISGATPLQFNGTFGITVIDADRFRYTMSAAAGNAAGTIAASANSTTATATTAAAHGFAVGTVTIAGASDAAYNGTRTIVAVPSSNTFTYCVGAATPPSCSGGAIIGPNTSDSVFANQGGGNTVSATTFSPHGFINGQTVYISGAEAAGYNGTFIVSVTGLNSFTYDAGTPQPAISPFGMYAASTTGTILLGFAPNHGFVAGESITIEGPGVAAGTYPIIDTFGSDYYFYVSTGVALPPVTETTYTVRSTTNHKAWVRLPNHGYAHNQEVRITGADPNGYNRTTSIRVCPGGGALVCHDHQNMFSFPLTGLQGPNLSGAVTASIKSTTARATAVNHGFTNGSTVTIAGALDPVTGTAATAFNGSKVVTVIDANTFAFTVAPEQGDAVGTITAAQVGGASGERDQIIRWVRGEDNAEDENVNSSLADIRASVHGDVLHSRPAVVNYNRFASSDDDVFVFYGANDGIFHAVRGGYAVPPGDTSGLTPGQEAWGFVPQEFFGQFKRMRNNSPIITSAFKKPYFMDGPIGVYTRDTDNNGRLGDAGDIVNLYITNRRGGRFVYALDVNNPLDPKFLWKISDATPGFAELGQTWSQPTVVTGLAGLSVPVLLFGAGYDPVPEDIDPALVHSYHSSGDVCLDAACAGPTRLTRSMGRGLYVVNALTGALIWSTGRTGSGATLEVANMNFAIPSDVTVIRNESAGATNRAYVGDTGGNIWRIDFRQDPDGASPNLALTTVTQLAALGQNESAAGRRKFLFPPDVVGMGNYDAVLIGSGDREHPFDTTVLNRFYMLKDKGPDTGPVTGATACDPTITHLEIADPTDACPPNPGPIPSLTDLTSNCLQVEGACADGETQADLSAKLGSDRGWFINLNAGEKVVGNAVTVGGVTFFNTNQPSATAGGGACGSNLGIARQYQVLAADATVDPDVLASTPPGQDPRSREHAGGGYLPSPVHVVVMLGGKPVEAVISGVQVSTPSSMPLSARLRKYWYKEVDPQ